MQIRYNLSYDVNSRSDVPFRAKNEFVQDGIDIKGHNNIDRQLQAFKDEGVFAIELMLKNEIRN